MWNTTLNLSKLQLMLSTFFHIILGITAIIQFTNTFFDIFMAVIIPIITIQWWKSCCYIFSITDELAIFHNINQIYWRKQRWYIIRKPLLLRYSILLHLKSRRSNKKQILWLMSDSIKPNDWRSLHYYLQQID